MQGNYKIKNIITGIIKVEIRKQQRNGPLKKQDHFILSEGLLRRRETGKPIWFEPVFHKI